MCPRLNPRLWEWPVVSVFGHSEFLREFITKPLQKSPWFTQSGFLHNSCELQQRQMRGHFYRNSPTGVKVSLTRTPADRAVWVKYVRAMHRTYRDKEREHWEARIASHSEQPKWLWATFNALLGRGRADRSSNPPSFTAEDYLASFQAKVQAIRDDTAGSPPPTFPSTTCILSAVAAIAPAELRRIIIAAAPKSCELDPLPTFLLQEHLDILLPLFTTICNRSIVGVMPLDQKRSILVPVIKRVGLDPTDPGNFRPIANVSFISKVIKKIIAYQLVPYLDANNLIPAIQSGFRKGHSTETLLLRLLSDIYGAIDRSQLTLLALFDVSAAFDTVDHEILLERLQISFGVT